MRFSRGFTIVELSIVLIILALIGGVFVSMSISLMDTHRASATRSKLAAIDAALVSFVAINRRLPCPADGTAATGLEVFGTQDNPCANQTGGVVPWAALGLSAADIEDGWGIRITYRMDPYLARTNAMDMSNCDPAGTGTPTTTGSPPRATCTTATGTCAAATLGNCVRPFDFLAGKGIEVRDSFGGTLVMNPAATPSTGAAYVLISHGDNQAGGYNGSGILSASTKGVVGNNEDHNRASASQSYYVDAPQNHSDSVTRFDDFVVRPSVISVIQRAHLGPRSH